MCTTWNRLNFACFFLPHYLFHFPFLVFFISLIIGDVFSLRHIASFWVLAALWFARYIQRRFEMTFRFFLFSSRSFAILPRVQCLYIFVVCLSFCIFFIERLDSFGMCNSVNRRLSTLCFEIWLVKGFCVFVLWMSRLYSNPFVCLWLFRSRDLMMNAFWCCVPWSPLCGGSYEFQFYLWSEYVRGNCFNWSFQISTTFNRHVGCQMWTWVRITNI